MCVMSSFSFDSTLFDSVSDSVSTCMGMNIVLNVCICGWPCSHLRSILLLFIGMWSWSCLSLAVYCMDMLLASSGLELDELVED